MVSKENKLNNLIENAKINENEYDCIVPFSGGKDSTWTLYYLIKEYNLNPLVVRFDHGFMRPNLRGKYQKLIKKTRI